MKILPITLKFTNILGEEGIDSNLIEEKILKNIRKVSSSPLLYCELVRTINPS
jgi:hypothetical protein